MEKNKFKELLLEQSIDTNDKQIDQLFSLLNLTLEKNKVMNLTAIKDEDEFLIKMIYDSILPINYFDLTNKKVLDIGTGGGFPGLPLAIVKPDAKYTLLDSTDKKIEHIKQILPILKLSVKTVSARSEEYALKNKETFDVVIARAVAPLNILIELALPYLKVGGTFIAMKGPNAESEIESCYSGFKKINCSVEDVFVTKLPIFNEERSIILIHKDKSTPNKYPRNYSEIKRKPL